MKTPLLAEPAATASSFRFLDLPIEIRAAIYGLLLTVPEPLVARGTNVHRRRLTRSEATERGTDSENSDLDSDTAPLKSNIETQLLRTCRQIKSEAEHILITSNHFCQIKFRVNIRDYADELLAHNVHLFLLDRKYGSPPNIFVLSHEIALPKSMQTGKHYEFFLLFRDLRKFCAAVARSENKSNQSSLTYHTVNLHDPIENRPHNEPYLNRRIQETLLAPYRDEFRNLRHFEVGGSIRAELKVTVEREICRPFPTNPDDVLLEVEDLKGQATGNLLTSSRLDYLWRLSSEWSNEGLRIIQRVLEEDDFLSTRDEGGMTFINRLVSHYFDLNSLIAQAHLRAMQTIHNERGVPMYTSTPSYFEYFSMEELGRRCLTATQAAMNTASKFPLATWKPRREQMAKLLFREAYRIRLIGDISAHAQAEDAIDEALELMPGNAEIKRERALIAKWWLRDLEIP